MCTSICFYHLPFFLSTYVETWIYIGISGSSVMPGAHLRPLFYNSQLWRHSPALWALLPVPMTFIIHSVPSVYSQSGCWCCCFTYESYSPSTHDRSELLPSSFSWSPPWLSQTIVAVPGSYPTHISNGTWNFTLFGPIKGFSTELFRKERKKWGCGEFTFLWHFPLKQIVCGPWHPVGSSSNKPIFLSRVTFIFCECFIYVYVAHHAHVQYLQRLIEMSGPLEVELGL